VGQSRRYFLTYLVERCFYFPLLFTIFLFLCFLSCPAIAKPNDKGAFTSGTFWFFSYIYTRHFGWSSDELQFSGLSCDHSKKLKIFHWDPFDYQSIIHALKGCSGLFYTFEPPQDQPTNDVTSFSFFNLLCPPSIECFFTLYKYIRFNWGVITLWPSWPFVGDEERYITLMTHHVLITDQDEFLKEAIADSFSNAHHCFCIYWCNI
jgi:hypothetical protein